MDREGKNGGTLRSFEKGQSGNPKGRPANKRNLISQLIQEIGDATELELVVESTQDGKLTHSRRMTYETDGEKVVFAVVAIQLLARAVGGDMDAIKVILNRTEGRYGPPINLNSPAENPLKVVRYTPGQPIPNTSDTPTNSPTN